MSAGKPGSFGVLTGVAVCFLFVLGGGKIPHFCSASSASRFACQVTNNTILPFSRKKTATSRTRIMGAGASLTANLATTLSSPAKIKELVDSDVGPMFEKLPLDELCTLRLALGRMMDKLNTVMDRKFAAKAVLPRAAKALCDRSCELLSEDHKQHIKDTVPYVVDIVRYVHVSKPLKLTLRRLLGLGAWFTTNLDTFGHAWEDLQSGCSNHMRALGTQLDALFQTQDLRARLGTYDPVGTGLSSPKVSAHVVQFVPAQCAPDQFGDDLVCNNDLECTYIHFLRLLALALDDGFQKTVNSTFKASGVRLVGGGVSSGGIKGYERMSNKMKSKDDHRFKPKPRPAHNIDVVRCLATFGTVEDMRKGFECVQRVFEDGKYVQFKNGMAWDDELAASRFHLRLVLGTGRFSLPSRRTMGELRQDTKVQTLWANYLQSEPVPLSVARGTWRRQAERALDWIRHDVPDSTAISMLCEVQMLLRDYTDMRTAMHEVYKITRATDPRNLGTDFAKYQRKRDIVTKFDRDGDTEFNLACRDGLAVSLPKLLADVSHSTVVRGIRTASEYVRPKCVKLLVGRVTKTELGSALWDAASGTAVRDGFDLGDARADVIRMLLDAKADPDEAQDNGVTPVYMAAQNGHADALQLLLSAKADPDKAQDNGVTPMYMAARNGHADALQLLLGAKADPDEAQDNGVTPMYMAAQNGHADALQLLLGAKADPDKALKDHDVTPMCMAAQNGHADALQLLIGAKADASKCPPSWPPLRIAESKGHHACAELLRAATT